MATSQETAFPSPVSHTFENQAISAALGADRSAITNAEHGPAVATIMAAAEGKKVLSLDVFDTLLVRNSKPEALRYWEWSQQVATGLGNNGNQKISAEDVLLARIEGLELSYRTRPRRDGCGEGSIHEVHQHISSALDLGPDGLQNLMENELAYEADNLKPNHTLLNCIRTFRGQGGRVILVSDMYLGAAEIKQLVARLVPEDHELISAIYSSADHIYSKRSGRLYGTVEDDLNLPGEAFLHMGDSFEGDVSQARASGWAALHLPISAIELAERSKHLKAFVEAMHARGLDVSRWAKL